MLRRFCVTCYRRYMTTTQSLRVGGGKALHAIAPVSREGTLFTVCGADFTQVNFTPGTAVDAPATCARCARIKANRR